MGMSAVKLEIWKTTLDAQECVAKTNRDLIYPLVNIQKTMENHHFLKMGKSTISMCHVLCRYVGLPEGSCANGKSLFLMGKSTISMVIFNSKLLVITRGYIIKFHYIPLNPIKPPLNQS